MVNYEEAYLLLAAAGRDFRALQGMTDPGVFADEIFGFHAQQAAEKASVRDLIAVVSSRVQPDP